MVEDDILTSFRNRTDRYFRAPVKFVVITLPPLELIPNSVQIASQSSDPSKALETVKLLTQTYNQGLMAMQSDTIHVLDIVPFWSTVKDHPSEFGFIHTTTACFSGQGEICNEPGTYIYWDSLHPTTKMHELIARRVQDFVRNL
ncbi:hypothetical protein CROQUDRAFT_694500 [Cronartium quercuum f. sp. fusiforme G11]|uniref:GDSL esterase/lipase n=1 Tax=Cronartium quercuum f. sp. fusiforme G11 TaxID=708437 RepID=A0A9P6N6B3_9BASI|nr:hypothetical protein CROQUDRAFT_694500 [Cronartium quercuum f. sp. fusiforme G11]